MLRAKHLLSIAVVILAALPAAAQVIFADLEVAERKQLEDTANSYRQSLEDRFKGTASDPAALLMRAKKARQNNDFVELIKALEEMAITSGKQRYRSWLDLAIAWRADRPAAGSTMAAAYNAWRVSQARGEKLETLLLMGGILRDRLSVERKQFEEAQKRVEVIDRGIDGAPENLRSDTPRARDMRDARLEALRQAAEAASVIQRTALLADAVFRDLYRLLGKDLQAEDIREELRKNSRLFAISGHPFPEATQQYASMCVRFTLPLAGDANRYRDQVGVAEAGGKEGPGQISIDGERLCVLGLKHGREYQMVYRKGLQSASGARLGEDSKFTVNVPDRPGLIGFRGNAYVLPKSGRGEVPLYTVNVDKAELLLARISDRSMHRPIALGQIGKDLSAAEMDEMLRHMAEPLANVSMEIQAPKNETITTGIPLRQLLDDRRRWVQTEESRLDPLGDGVSKKTRSSDERTLSTRVRMKVVHVSDPVTHQMAIERKHEVGVYALMTEPRSTPVEMADDDKDKRDEDEEQDSRERKKPSVPSQKRQSKAGPSGSRVQWVVITDIGITYYRTEAELHVVCRSLTTGKPIERVNVQLVSAGNRVLAELATNAEGVTTFPSRLTRGTLANRLAAIMAYAEGDFSFIDFGRDRLDLSHLDVGGRQAPARFDAFVHSDRGIYRPGSEILTTVVMRDLDGNAPSIALPISLKLRASTGQIIYQRAIKAEEWRLGGATVALPIPGTAPQGSLDIEATFAGEPASLGKATVQVDQFRPDRARLDFDAAWSVKLNGTDAIDIVGGARAQYLYGYRTDKGEMKDAPARDLRGEIQVAVQRANSPFPGCYEAFEFGGSEERLASTIYRTFSGQTDPVGRIPIVAGNVELPITTSPLAGLVTLTLFDGAGPVAMRSQGFPIPRARPWIGVAKAPVLSASAVDGRIGARIDIIALNADGTSRVGARLSYRLMRERTAFVWHNQQGLWKHQATLVTDEIAKGAVPARLAPTSVDGTCQGANASLALDQPVGRYQVEISDEHGTRTTVRFATGWSGSASDDPRPDQLSVSADKASYAPGETATFAVETPFDGEVMLAITDQNVRRWASASSSGRKVSINVKIPDAWANKNLYALATAFRRNADGSFERGPSRAVGAVHFRVARDARQLPLKVVSAINSAAPSAPLELNVCIATPRGDCDDNFTEEVFVTAYAVDEGLLSLTGHGVADPAAHFFGQRKLALEVMDTYGRILTSEREGGSRQGGDRPSRLVLSNYTSDKIVAKAKGPVPLVKGRAKISFEEAGIDGTIRMWVVAWSKTGVGQAASTNALLRSPLVAKLALPRFLAPGDKPRIPWSIVNIEATDDDYRVEVTAKGRISVERVTMLDGTVLAADRGQQAKFVTRLRSDEVKRGYLELAVNSDAPADGFVELEFAVHGSAATNPATVLRRFRLDLRSAEPPRAELVTRTINPGEELRVTTQLFDQVVRRVFGRQGAQKVKLQARFSNGVPSVATTVSLRGLETPIRSINHLVWSGMLLMEEAAAPERDRDLVRIIQEIEALQTRWNGAFLPYRPLGGYVSMETGGLTNRSRTLIPDEESLWRTALVYDFLARARDAGLPHDDTVLQQAGSLLQKFLSRDLGSKCEPHLLYAAVVLARDRKFEVEDIKSLKENCLDENSTPLHRAMLAAAMREFGLVDEARATLIKADDGGGAFDWVGSSEGAHAMLLAFLARADAPKEVVSDVLKGFGAEDARALTLETRAWLAKAVTETHSASNSATLPISVKVTPAGVLEPQRGRGRAATTRFLDFAGLATAPVLVRNDGTLPVTATFVLHGVPAVDRQLTGDTSGYVLTRAMFNHKGENILETGGAIPVNELLYVVLTARPKKAREPGEKLAPILLVDLLAAGVEIVSDDIFGERSPAAGKLPNLPREVRRQGLPRFIERRDDRYVAIVGVPDPAVGSDAPPEETAFTVGYAVRAVTPGAYVLPPAAVEDLSKPEISARTAPSQLTVESAQ